ncbi:hypothetical protein GCM10022221_71550 [Actinocorallia aurea]
MRFPSMFDRSSSRRASLYGKPQAARALTLRAQTIAHFPGPVRRPASHRPTGPAASARPVPTAAMPPAGGGSEFAIRAAAPPRRAVPVFLSGDS